MNRGLVLEMQYPLLGDVRNRTFSPPFFGGNQLVGSFILHYVWYILMGSVDQERAKQKMQGIQDWWLCFSNFSIIFPGSLLFGTCRLVYHQIPYCNLLQGYFGSMHWHAQFSDTLKCALNPDMTFLAPKKYAKMIFLNNMHNNLHPAYSLFSYLETSSQCI